MFWGVDFSWYISRQRAIIHTLDLPGGRPCNLVFIIMIHKRRHGRLNLWLPHPVPVPVPVPSWRVLCHWPAEFLGKKDHVQPNWSPGPHPVYPRLVSPKITRWQHCLSSSLDLWHLLIFVWAGPRAKSETLGVPRVNDRINHVYSHSILT
jgi:hypothetical protein